MSKTLRFLPLLLMLLLTLALAAGLVKKAPQDPVDMRHIGQHFGDFSIPQLASTTTGKTPPALTNQSFVGQVSVVSVFASWCQPCIAEHAVLMKLAESQKVNIYGIAWKDTAANVARYLNERGNPFQKIAIDTAGNSTVPLALTGVPELFVLDRRGAIAFHYRTAITEELLNQTLLPLIDKLNHETR